MEEVEPVGLPKPEAQHFLKLSAHCLSVRDFSGCRNNALLAGELDYSLPEVEQILAVVNVLLAGERCFDDDNLDWYAILQVHPIDSDNEKLVQNQVIKLLVLLNPIKNTFAFSTEAFDLVLDAWSVLSDPLKKSRFDKEVTKIGEARETENVCEFVETFWTVCPYCYYVYEYERVYADFCLRCMNCENAFHGAAINGPPPQTVILDGKEHYGCWLGFFKMHYRGEMNVEGNKKLRAQGAIFSTFTEISDDDHDYYESSKELPDAHCHGRTGNIDPVENKMKCGNEMNNKRGEGTGVMDSNDVKFSEDYANEKENEMGGLEFHEGGDLSMLVYKGPSFDEGTHLQSMETKSPLIASCGWWQQLETLKSPLLQRGADEAVIQEAWL